MVFEDDAVFCKDFSNKLDTILQNIDTIDTILYFGGRFIPNYIMKNSIRVNKNLIKYDYNQKWDRMDCDRGTFGYIITRKIAELLINSLHNPPFNLPIDDYITSILRLYKLDMYSTYPLLCHSFPSWECAYSDTNI